MKENFVEKERGHGLHVGRLVDVSDYWGKRWIDVMDDEEHISALTRLHSPMVFENFVGSGGAVGGGKWAVGTPIHYPPTITLSIL